MKKMAFLVLIALVCVMMMPHSSQGHAIGVANEETTITLHQEADGYSGCRDTYVFQYAPDDNYSSQDHLRVGYRQQYAGLLQFDLSPIPRSATITQATLHLYGTGWSGRGHDVAIDAYRILRNVSMWQATWNQAQSGNLWGQPGCSDTSTDRRDSPEITVSTSGIGKWYAFDPTTLVQAWVDGSAANNGVLLRISSPTSTRTFRLASAQHGTVSLRPRLVITYRTAGSPTPTPTATAPAGSTPTHTPMPTRTATPTATTAAAPMAAANHPPQVDTVTPSSGSSAVGQTQVFTTTWSDPDGWQHLKQVYFHFGASPDLQNNVTLLYNAKKNKLWIRSDDGTTWSGGFTPGSANVLENNQAQVYSEQTTVQGSGDTLSVQWAISFKESFTGDNKTGLKCKDVHGARGRGQWKGTWTITQSPTATHTPTIVVTNSPTPTPTYTVTPSPTPPENTLTIGHITDAQTGAAWIYSQRLASVASIISQQAQVMVDTGDCTEHGTVEETDEYMNVVTSNVSIPWRAIPGNHDTPWVFEQYIGPLEWSWDVGEYRLIGINTESIDYTALDQALTTEKPSIVFGHLPLSWCAPEDQEKLRQRFRAFNVPIYIAGHTHEDSLETDPESGTILLVGKNVGLGDYRLITLRGFEVESISFESAW